MGKAAKRYDGSWVPEAPQGTERYWLEKAEEARAFRDTMHHPQTREAMLSIVTSYELLAKAARH